MITPKRAAKVMAEGVDENGNPITQVKIRTAVSYTHLVKRIRVK